MLELSFPPNENQRIAALHSLQILDTPPEERFDRITRIASRLFNVPIALISLVDSDRLWFKSRRGLSISESSRSGSFCSQAILSKEIFIVPDAKPDPRFSAHPWVVAPPAIRFYAGCPLADPDGRPLGTLAILDCRPRRMSESDLKSLKDLASVVEEELGKRLAPASEETLGKKAEAALKEAEARPRLALQAGRIGIWDWNIVTGKIVWSPGHEALWGMAPGEFKGTYEEFEARLHPKDREGMNRAVAESIAKRRTYRHEFRIIGSDGRTHWIAGQGEPFFDEAGRPVRMLGIVVDITERKQTEEALRESEERLRLALDAAQMGTFDWDIPHNRLVWSRGHEKLWGLAPGEFGGTYEAFSERVHPEDLPGIHTEVARCIAAREPISREFRVIWPDGSVHWVLGRGEFTFGEDGRPLRMRGVALETTERHRAEEALYANRELLNNIIDSTPSYIFAMDRQHRYTLINEATTGLLGMPKEEILGKTEHGAFPKELADALQAANNRVMATGVPLQIEEVVGGKGGPPRTMIAVKFPVRDAQGKIIGLGGVATDITERKQAEEALRESEQMNREQYAELHQLYQTAPVGLALVDRELRFVRINDRLAEINGRPAEQQIGRTISEVLPQLWPSLEPIYRRAMSGEPVLDVQIHGVTPAQPGAERDWVASYYPVLGDDGFVRGVSVVVQEVTESKQAEEALRKSEERFQLASRATNDAIWDWDLVTNAVRWNERFQTLFGYQPEEIESGVESWTNRIHPEDKGWVLSEVDAAIKQGHENWSGEYRFRRRDGSYVAVFDRGYIVHDENGRPVRMIGAMLDITERKRAEEALQESQRTLATLISNLPGVVYRCRNDKDWTTVYASDRMLDLFGYPASDFLAGKVQVGQFINPDDQEPVWNSIQAALREKRPYQLTYRIRAASGQAKWLWEQGQGIYSPSGELLFLEGFATDITERKEAEAALIDSRNRLALAARAGNVGIWDWNIKSGELVWDDTMFTLYGIRREDFTRNYDGWRKCLHKDDLARAEAEAQAALSGGKPFDTEFRVVHPDGSIRHQKAFATVFYDDHGRPDRMVGTNWDITEKKEAEDRLKSAQQRLRDLIDGIGPSIFVGLMKPDGILIEANRPALNAASLRPEDVIGKPFEETYWWAYSEEVQQQLRAAIARAARGEASRYDVQLRVGENQFIIIDFSLQPVRDKTGQVVFLVPSANVITERKRAEEAVKESHERLERALEASQTGTWRVDLRTGIDTRDASLNRMLGLPSEPSTQPVDDWFLHVHPDDLPAIRSAWEKGLVSGLYDVEHRLVRRDGRVLWVYDRGVMVRDDAGQLLYAIGAAMDITERKQAEEEIRRLNQDLERRVVERTAQLETVNKELESFSYSVSHDLRAPLRATAGFSRVLLNRYADRLDAQGRDFLQRIDAASLRMGELIEDLLNLSRIARRDMRKEPFDLAALARSIATEIQKADPSRKVTFLIQDSLNAEGDPRLLRIVLENLLGNAWKFTSKRPKATIEFGQVEQEGRPVYFVRDNGAGFDMAYADKLFGAFQRLHSQIEFEGTGIGLATVQRIIHRHGGKVWAEGKIEKGATFFFTL